MTRGESFDVIQRDGRRKERVFSGEDLEELYVKIGEKVGDIDMEEVGREASEEDWLRLPGEGSDGW